MIGNYFWFKNKFSNDIILSKYSVSIKSYFLEYHIVWKVSLFGVFLAHIFPHLDWIRRDTPYLSIFSPNARKHGPENLRIRTLFTQCYWSMLRPMMQFLQGTTISPQPSELVIFLKNVRVEKSLVVAYEFNQLQLFIGKEKTNIHTFSRYVTLWITITGFLQNRLMDYERLIKDKESFIFFKFTSFKFRTVTAVTVLCPESCLWPLFSKFD